MPFELSEIVPWGRSFDEYRAMFALTDDDLKGRILGCGDGPASFNAEATRRGTEVVSIDPLYHYPRDEIAQRIEATRRQVIDQARRNQDQFVWRSIPSIEALEATRLAAMRAFLDDYDAGRTAGRYVAAELPRLPLEARAFDLALSSHFLFLYDQHLDLTEHLACVREMLRVAREVRVFPLLALDGGLSQHVEPVIDALAADGVSAAVERVDYEFQKGGDSMLRITKEPAA